MTGEWGAMIFWFAIIEIAARHLSLGYPKRPVRRTP